MKGKCGRKEYRGQIDYFAAFCPDNGKVYLVPVADAPDFQCFLRLNPPRNNQHANIRWAKDYEIGTASELGEFSDMYFDGEVGIITPQ
jgi:hypothetical protein